MVSDPVGTEEGRAFFQERLGSFGQWMFWPAFIFLWVGHAPSVASGAQPPRDLVTLEVVCHLAATLVLFAVWRLCRRPRAISATALRVLDGAGVITVGLLWVGMGAGFLGSALGTDNPESASMVGSFTVLLACTHTVFIRAILVPSTFGRTMVVGAIAMGGIPPLVMVHLVTLGYGPGPIAGGVVTSLVWSGAAVAVSAVTSRVIFGLRREVERTRRLGQYTIEHLIGAGGMGEVYRASHAMLRRPTAIKLLNPDVAAGEAIARFEREVRLTASLSHPNTISVYDYGRTPAGLFYYAMEFLDGVDLERLVRDRGPLRAGRTIAILDQICGSLAEAHGVGLIHRDIKPANVILCPRGGEYDVVKVVDFGLVKEINASDNEVKLSGANVIRGTPAYLAPEAIRGDDIDGRADLYAVGAVGYWLLTGTMVFTGVNLIEMCSHHLHTPPTPPAERAPDRDIPTDLAAVITRCLAKYPEARYPSAGALREALRACAAAGSWTGDDAAAWWRDNPPRPVAQEPAAMPTLAVDIAERIDEA